MSARGAHRLRSPLPWLALLLAVYLLGPVVAFLVRTARTGLPASPGTGAALLVSVETASVATAVVALLGLPLAYQLSRGRGRTSAVVGALVALPIALPPLMSGILLFYLVGPYTTLGRLFGDRLTDDRLGIVLAQLFVSAPFLVIAARAAFAAVDPALEEVAATLGHRRWSRFLRVALPAAAPGVTAGLLLAWLRAFGEFGATVVLAYHPYSLPVLTYVQFSSTGLPATVLPVAASLGAALLVLLLVLTLPRLRRPYRAATALPPPVSPVPVAREPLRFELTGAVGGFRLRVGYHCRSGRLALVGPSGAGKTLSLRLLAGLAPAAGPVQLGATDLAELPVQQRRVGYLPQDPALFPHLPVWRQLRFGVAADPGLAAYWLDRFHLAELADRRPDQLSGGQRRRVALARALNPCPRLLLLDEPFSGLDGPARDRLARELRRLQRDAGVSTVVVSHDVRDAVELADEVLVLDGGEVLQGGPITALRESPGTPRVAGLLGVPNVFTGTVAADGIRTAGGWTVAADTVDCPPGTPVTWRVAPEQVRLGDGPLVARVSDLVDYGEHRQVELTLPGGWRLLARTAAAAPAVGTACRLQLPPAAVRCWPQPVQGTGWEEGVVDDREILGRISELVAEEHRLRGHADGGHGLTEQERGRLADVEQSLDRCWDLLRQRRAREEAGQDPESAEPRPVSQVENYQQ